MEDNREIKGILGIIGLIVLIIIIIVGLIYSKINNQTEELNLKLDFLHTIDTVYIAIPYDSENIKSNSLDPDIVGKLKLENGLIIDRK